MSCTGRVLFVRHVGLGWEEHGTYTPAGKHVLCELLRSADEHRGVDFELHANIGDEREVTAFWGLEEELGASVYVSKSRRVYG